MNILPAILIGIGATALLDLWSLFLRRAFNMQGLNFCLVGRWLLHMPKGTFAHAKIAEAEAHPSECLVGWTAHYAIGIAFALLFIGLVSSGWLEDPTLLPALIFGAATVLFPYFLMQPAFGLGIAASRTPHPMQIRLKSLVAHIVFGFGLYLSAVSMTGVI